VGDVKKDLDGSNIVGSETKVLSSLLIILLVEQQQLISMFSSPLFSVLLLKALATSCFHTGLNKDIA
jgi:hypothetical protein